MTLIIMRNNKIPAHPPLDDFEYFFLYVTPGIPVLIEYPFELIEPRFVL